MEVDGGVRLGAGCGNWGAEADEKAEFFAAHFIYRRDSTGRPFAQPHFTLTARSSMWPGSPAAAAPRTILLQRLDLFTKVTVGKEFG